VVALRLCGLAKLWDWQCGIRGNALKAADTEGC
jgi:hypothetical protein